MQKFFVTIGEITLAVYGEDSNTVFDTMRLLYPGFEVGYPTEKQVEIDENTCNKEVYERGYLVGVWKRRQTTASA